jgi:hypothetical protein
MTNGYSRSPKLLKGALVRLSSPFMGPVPTVIVFQYNPETLTRSLTPWELPSEEAESGRESAPGTAQPFDPGESFTLRLELDATDALEQPESHPVAVISGVADRIAALEMLLYPDPETTQSGLRGSRTQSLGTSSGGGGGTGRGSRTVPRPRVPVVLFVWGAGRIVPVRLTSFSVEEQAFTPTLYPIRATVSVGLRVLTESAFPRQNRTASEKLAIAAYWYTMGQKYALSVANMANNVESILGMLPI